MNSYRSRSLWICSLTAGALSLGSTVRSASADVVLEWNAAIEGCFEAEADNVRSAGKRTRIWALAHLAMLGAIRGVPCPVGTEQMNDSSAEMRIAATVAVHDVLMTLIPEHAARWTVLLEQCDTAKATDEAMRDARIVGTAAAKAVLDRFAAVPLDSDGAPTVDAAASLLMLGRADRYRAKPPYFLNGIGAVVPAFRNRREFTDLVKNRRLDETEAIDCFWTDRPEIGWNRLARDLAAQHRLCVHDAARLLAALNTALADSWLANAAARRAFRAPRSTEAPLRPPRTGPQFSAYGAWDEPRTWTESVNAVITLPPVPDYPSFTGAMAGAAAAVLERELGRELYLQPIVVSPVSRQPEDAAVLRQFSSLVAAGREGALAAVLTGREFTESAIAGYDLGFAVGRWIGRRETFRRHSRF